MTYHLYKNSSSEKLIAIIEQSHLYFPKTVAIVKAILEEKNLRLDIIKELATSLMHKQIETFFGNYNIWNDELVLPTSIFLSQEEVSKIFDIEFDNYQANRLDFSTDLNIYLAA